MAIHLQDLLSEFNRQVMDRSSEVDPEDQRDWCDLAFGWALGKGLSVKDAEAFHDLYLQSF